MTPSKTHEVGKLERGTVLDHLRSGSALRALRAIALPLGSTVMVGMNLQSKRFGSKDIIKIQDHELSEAQAARVALINPDATMAIIRDYSVFEKVALEPPRRFRGLIRCTNPVCIVHEEKIAGAFMVEQTDPIIVRCEYCERSITADHFEFA